MERCHERVGSHGRNIELGRIPSDGHSQRSVLCNRSDNSAASKGTVDSLHCRLTKAKRALLTDPLSGEGQNPFPTYEAWTNRLRVAPAGCCCTDQQR